jgi:hypothetical protein
MKKLSLLAFFLTIHPLLGHDASHLCTLVGSIVFPTGTRPPALTAYYKGLRISITEGSYHIPDKHGADSEICLLFTLGPIRTQVHEDTNTISDLCLASNASYKYFKLKKNLNYFGWHPVYTHMGRRNDEQPWFIVEERLPKNRCVLPESALLVLLDPQIIDRLENEPWQTQGNTCRMPRIVIKEKITAKKLKHMAHQSLLTSLDLDPFHRPPNTITQAGGQRPAFTELVMPTEHHEQFGFGN